MSPSVDAAWQAALGAEQQAVFGYALLGPRLTSADEVALARRCAAEHGALRDATASGLTAAGLTPQAAAADYPALYPVPDDTAARRLAVRLEQDAAEAWRALYAAVAADPHGARSGALRAAAQGALTASAVRAVRWRGRSVPFPGI